MHSPALQRLVPSSLAPSRRDNPFATCWTRPGKIPFRFGAGESAEQLVHRLALKNWRGAIVGPHGSGKSTLVETIKPVVIGSGIKTVQIILRDGERSLPRETWNEVANTRRIASNAQELHTVLIIDGYEQLGWLDRFRVLRGIKRAGAGLLVTSHAPTRLPTLVSLAPDRALVCQLVADLWGDGPAPFTPAVIAASHASHGSNVREIFFDLYDQYESWRRGDRTGVRTTA